MEILRDLRLPRSQRLGVVLSPAQHLPPQAGKGLIVQMIEVRNLFAREFRLHIYGERPAQRRVG